MKILIITLIFLYSNLSNANENIKLFKYNYGEEKNSIIQNKPTHKCLKKIGPEYICLNKTKFTGIRTKIGFKFKKDKLIEVVVNFKNRFKYFTKFIKQIQKKYTTVILKNSHSEIDLPAYSRQYKPAIFLRLLNGFEKEALNKKDLTYIFYPAEIVRKLRHTSQTALEITNKAPNRVIEIEYTIKGAEIYIIYRVPKLTKNFSE